MKTGIILAQRLTIALCLKGIEYQKLANLLYEEVQKIANEQEIGDWLSFPNGDTYTKTFSVGKEIRDISAVLEAFKSIMDGTDINDLRAMTGLSLNRCKEIMDIYLNL